MITLYYHTITSFKCFLSTEYLTDIISTIVFQTHILFHEITKWVNDLV